MWTNGLVMVNVKSTASRPQGGVRGHMLLASPGGVSPMAGPGSRLTRSSVCVSVRVDERDFNVCLHA
ncbi:hypothetical protein NQZ68_017743 [Dissostichus eleginoides]|nr:hypothetical protein NQZ68_017743 [Dissostichus eleginoides]